MHRSDISTVYVSVPMFKNRVSVETRHSDISINIDNDIEKFLIRYCDNVTDP